MTIAQDLTLADAEAMLPGGPLIHTFTEIPDGFAGEDWPRHKVLTLLREATVIRQSGNQAPAAGHGLAVLRDHDGRARVTWIETERHERLHLAIGTYAAYLAGLASESEAQATAAALTPAEQTMYSEITAALKTRHSRITTEEAPVRDREDGTEYDVRWVIDITAPDPLAAAREAHSIQRDPASRATVFIVTELGDYGAQWRVDLDDPQAVEVLRTRETARLIAGTGLDTATGPGDPDAPARLRALQAAMADARQALAGDSNNAEHDVLRGLAETAAAFLGEKPPGDKDGN